MARHILLLLAVVLSLASLSYVHACESACRSDPVTYLTEKYAAILNSQANKIKDLRTAALAKAEIPEIVDMIDGRNNVIDRTIFSLFRGPCKNAPGQRHPDELCGSAKSIACFAAWGHKPKSVLQMVHDEVTSAVRQHYAALSQQYPDIKKVVVDGLEKFCPKKCQNWVKPFEDTMLLWEKKEHPSAYLKIPNCLALDNGGV
ncbi:hypothetical protein BGZ72_002280 [Mortierella alpina]|nr:hypothetical protein BGZ72_002280 [Mortierella alpina]